LAEFFTADFWDAALRSVTAEMTKPTYWLAVLQIIWINILLSGDNALVIALACRGLHGKRRLWGMVFGAGVAILLRIVFAGLVAQLMSWPFLKLFGGLALLYIAAKMLVPDDPDENEIQATEHMLRAVWTIAVADVVMSLDNVIAIVSAAQGSFSLLVIGLAVSIPLIVAGAALIVAVLDRAPILIWAGAALLGWIAGEVIVTDPAIEPWLQRQLTPSIARWAEVGVPVLGAALVPLVGGLWRRHRTHGSLV
jgi:YjbE family integral membrane protein